MSSVRVLLLEDSRVQTRLIQELLSQQDGGAFCLECADCLTTGLHRLAIGGIDVVLLDLLLPESQGLETFLRVYRAAPNVPIVVLTGLDDRMLAVTAVQEGAEDYLVKGQVDGENLARALRYAVERHRRRRAEELWDGADQQFRGARAIQQKLLPTVPELSSFDIGGMSYCAVGACGDYFDYIPMPGTRIGIVVADVSGHGLGPSILMASTRAYLRAFARTHDDIGEIITLANHALCEDTKGESFATLILVCLDPHTRSLKFVNAGHPAGVVLDPSGTLKMELASSGFPLGVVPDAEYQSSPEMILEPGELVALVSDGILEERSSQQGMFGMERALNVVRLYRKESALQIVDNLYHAVRAFTQNVPQTDDITAVVLKVGVFTPD